MVYEDLSREEMCKMCFEKDRLIQVLKKQIEINGRIVEYYTGFNPAISSKPKGKVIEFKPRSKSCCSEY